MTGKTRQRRCERKFRPTFPTRPRRKLIRHALPITAMAFTADGRQLVVGGYHELLVWDAKSGTLVSRVGNIPQRTFGIAFSPDYSWLAVAGGSPGVSGEVRLIPWGDGPKKRCRSQRFWRRMTTCFLRLHFGRMAAQLAAGGADGSVRVFDVATGAEKLQNQQSCRLGDRCLLSAPTASASPRRAETRRQKFSTR